MLQLPSVALSSALTYLFVVLVAALVYWCAWSLENPRLGSGETERVSVPSAASAGLRGLSLIILVGFQGTRHQVGTDTRTYLSIFESMPLEFSAAIRNLTHEPLFIFTVWVTKSVGFDSRGFFLVAAFLAVAPVFAVANQLGREPRVILYYGLLGFYLAGFNTLRQAIATAFLLLGFVLLAKGGRRGILAGVAVLLGSVGFHFTAIIPSIVLLCTFMLRAGYRSVAGILAVVGLIASYQMGIIHELAGVAGYGSYLSLETSGIGALASLALFVLVGLIVFGANVQRGGVVLGLYSAGVICLFLSLRYLYLARLASYFLIAVLVTIGSTKRLSVGFARGLSLFLLAVVSFVIRVIEFGGLVPYDSWLGD